VLTLSADQPAPARQTIRAQHAEARQNLWQYGVVLMLLVLVVESVIGRG
jgi:hypothetical protein